MHHRIHHRIKEMFTGKRNIFTVTFAFIGIYFFTYSLVNIVVKEIGYLYTMLIGIVIIFVGGYVLDSYHKKH